MRGVNRPSVIYPDGVTFRVEIEGPDNTESGGAERDVKWPAKTHVCVQDGSPTGRTSSDAAKQDQVDGSRS